MSLPWRRRKAIHRAKKIEAKISSDNLEMEITIPTHFLCPISLDLMKDPVTLCTGITYDRGSIEKWIDEGKLMCPVSNQTLSNFDQIPNHFIRKMIQNWCVENKSYGIERIPTPRVPVTPYEVLETCKKVMAATERGDQKMCMELVGKVKGWVKEGERNKRCIAENGAGCVLSAAFKSFSKGLMEENVGLLQEILSVLVWMFPLGVEGQSDLGSLTSLLCIVWILKSGDLCARKNAVLVLKKLLCLDHQVHVRTLLEVEGIDQELIRLIKEPICPTVTKASLAAISFMISPLEANEKIASSFLDMGLVPLLIEILVDGDKSMCEKDLVVLDRLCDCQKGRDKACGNALIVPVLFSKISLVPDLTSEFCVSILWKLSKNDMRDGGSVVLVEALQLSGKENPFQKLLVLLQVGCSESTKEKAKDLLKSLNVHRSKLDCVDSSMDFI